MNDYKKYRGRGRGSYVHSNNYRNPNGFNNDMGRNNRFNTPMHMNPNFRDNKARWPRPQLQPQHNYHWRGPPPMPPYPRAPFIRRPYASPPRHSRGPLLPQRPVSPLPGSEEARQKAIAEASARIKEQLNLEGDPNQQMIDNSTGHDGMCPPPPVPHPLLMHPSQIGIRQQHNTVSIDNLEQQQQQQQQQKVAKRKTRRSLSTLDNSSTADVEQLRQKILTQFTHMSKGKIQNLVNNPGSSRYDAALQHLVRDMRLHLSSELRDMYNKRNDTIESNEMIDHFNSIVPDLGVELVSLPHTMVEQLSKILQLDMNNEGPTPSHLEECTIVEPENMFKQAEMMLSDVSFLEPPPLEFNEVDGNYESMEECSDAMHHGDYSDDPMMTDFHANYSSNLFDNQHFSVDSMISNFADSIENGFSTPNITQSRIAVGPDIDDNLEFPMEDMSMSPVPEISSSDPCTDNTAKVQLIDYDDVYPLQEIALPSGLQVQGPCLDIVVETPLTLPPPSFSCQEIPEEQTQCLDTVDYPLQEIALPPSPAPLVPLPSFSTSEEQTQCLDIVELPVQEIVPEEQTRPLDNVCVETQTLVSASLPSLNISPDQNQPADDNDSIHNSRSVSPLSRRLQEQNCLNPQRPPEHDGIIYEETNSMSNPSNPNLQLDLDTSVDPKSISFKKFWLPKTNSKLSPNVDKSLLATPDHPTSPANTSADQPIKTTSSDSKPTSAIASGPENAPSHRPDLELRNFRNRSRSKSPDRRTVKRPSLDDRIKQLMKIKDPLKKLDESQLNSRQMRRVHKLRQMERDRLTAKIVFDPKYTKRRSVARSLNKSDAEVRTSQQKQNKQPLLKIKFNEPKHQKIAISNPLKVVTAAQLLASKPDEPEPSSPILITDIKQEPVCEPGPSEPIVESLTTKKPDRSNRAAPKTPIASAALEGKNVDTEAKRQEKLIRAVPQSTKEALLFILDSILQNPSTSAKKSEEKIQEHTPTKNIEEIHPKRANRQSKDNTSYKIKLKRSSCTPPPPAPQKRIDVSSQKPVLATSQRIVTIISPQQKKVTRTPAKKSNVTTPLAHKSQAATVQMIEQSRLKTAQEQMHDDLHSIDQMCEDIQKDINEPNVVDNQSLITIVKQEPIEIEDDAEQVQTESIEKENELVYDLLEQAQEKAQGTVVEKLETIHVVPPENLNQSSTEIAINDQIIDRSRKTCPIDNTLVNPAPSVTVTPAIETHKKEKIKLKRDLHRIDKPIEQIIKNETEVNSLKDQNEIDKLFNKIIRDTFEVDKSSKDKNEAMKTETEKPIQEVCIQEKIQLENKSTTEEKQIEKTNTDKTDDDKQAKEPLKLKLSESRTVPVDDNVKTNAKETVNKNQKLILKRDKSAENKTKSSEKKKIENDTKIHKSKEPEKQMRDKEMCDKQIAKQNEELEKIFKESEIVEEQCAKEIDNKTVQVDKNMNRKELPIKINESLEKKHKDVEKQTVEEKSIKHPEDKHEHEEKRKHTVENKQKTIYDEKSTKHTEELSKKVKLPEKDNHEEEPEKTTTAELATKIKESKTSNPAVEITPTKSNNIETEKRATKELDKHEEKSDKKSKDSDKAKHDEKSSSGSSHRASSKSSNSKRSESRSSKSNRDHLKSLRKSSSRSHSEPRINNQLVNLSNKQTVLERMIAIDTEIQTLMHKKWKLYKELQTADEPPSSTSTSTTTTCNIGTNTVNPRKRTMVTKETNTDESPVRKQAKIQTDPLVSKATNTDTTMLNRKQAKIQTDPLVSKETNTQVSPISRKQAKIQTDSLVSTSTNTDASPIRKTVKIQTNLFVSISTNTDASPIRKPAKIQTDLLISTASNTDYTLLPVCKQAIVQTDLLELAVPALQEQQQSVHAVPSTFDNNLDLSKDRQSATPSELSDHSRKRQLSVTPSESNITENVAQNAETDSEQEIAVEQLVRHKRKRKKQPVTKRRKRQKVQSEEKSLASKKHVVSTTTSDNESLTRMQTRKSEKLSITIEQVVKPPVSEDPHCVPDEEKRKKKRVQNENVRKTRSLFKETEIKLTDQKSSMIPDAIVATEEKDATKELLLGTRRRVSKTKETPDEQTLQNNQRRDRSDSSKQKIETEDDHAGERSKSREMSVESNRSRSRSKTAEQNPKDHTDDEYTTRERSLSKESEKRLIDLQQKPKSRKEKVKPDEIDTSSTTKSLRSKTRRKQAKADTLPQTSSLMTPSPVKLPKPKIKIKLGKLMSDDEDPLIGFNTSDIATQSRIEIENIISKSEKELFKSKKGHAKVIDDIDTEQKRKKNNRKSDESIDKTSLIDCNIKDPATCITLEHSRLKGIEATETDKPTEEQILLRVKEPQLNANESDIIQRMHEPELLPNTSLLVPKIETNEVTDLMELQSPIISINTNEYIAVQSGIISNKDKSLQSKNNSEKESDTDSIKNKPKEPTKVSTARRKKFLKRKRTSTEMNNSKDKSNDSISLPITPCFVSLERVHFVEKSIEEEPKECSNEAPNEASNENPNEVSNQDANETVNEDINEVLNEDLNEASNEKLNEASNKDLNEASNEQLNEASNEDLNEVSNEQLNEASNEDLNEASNEVDNNKPKEDDNATIVETVEECKEVEEIEIKLETVEPVLELDLTKTQSTEIEDEIDEEGIFCMGHQKSILDIKVVGDEFLAASEDGTIYKYCLKTGSLQDAYTGHTRAVTCMHVTNGKILNIPSTILYSGSLDYTLKCYNIDTAEVLHDVSLEQAIQCMDAAWGHIFLGTYEGLLFIYNMEKKLLHDLSLTIASSTVLMIKATQEGSRQVLILASRKREIMVRDAFTGLLLRTMCQDHRPTIYSLYLDRSMVYCGTSDKGILILNFNNGNQIGSFTAGKGVVCMLMHRGLLFAGCYDGMIYVYNSLQRSHVATISGPGDGMLLSLAIHGNQIIAGTKKDHLLKIWRIPQEILKQCNSS